MITGPVCDHRDQWNCQEKHERAGWGVCAGNVGGQVAVSGMEDSTTIRTREGQERIA